MDISMDILCPRQTWRYRTGMNLLLTAKVRLRYFTR